MRQVLLTEQEINDLLSALSFFQREYPERKASIHIRADMKVLERKLWKVLKSRSKAKDEREG